MSDTRYDLTDVTFVIPVRIESSDRYRNVQLCVRFLSKYFNTKIIVLEADYEEKLSFDANDKVDKIFVEDFDLIFYRTRYINKMIKQSSTPYIAVWDTDALIIPSQLISAINKLRNENADFVLPYDGRFLSLTNEIKSELEKNPDPHTLEKYIEDLIPINGNRSEGGAFIVNRKSYEKAGLENENFYGWGPEDKERVKRMEILGNKVTKADGPLFHLPHKRGNNSWYFSNHIELSNRKEVVKICSMSTSQLVEYVKTSIIKTQGQAPDRDKSIRPDPPKFLLSEHGRFAYLYNFFEATDIITTSIVNFINKANQVLQDHRKDQLSKKTINQMNELELGYFKFSFVRNPFERLVLCYEKMINIQKPKDDFDFRPYFECYYEFNHRYKLKVGMTFEEFVKTIVTIPHHLADHHFKSQYNILYNSGLGQLDFVGKYESLDTDWQYIVDKFNLDANDLVLNFSEQTKKKNYANYYTPKLLDMLFKYYEEDIINFGYQDTYIQLKALI